jgi:hypothetical protein
MIATILTRKITLSLVKPVRLEVRNGALMEARYATIRDSSPERMSGDRYFQAPIPGRHVSVTGPNIKKNGEYGLRVMYRGWSVPDRHGWDGPLPEWLEEIVREVDTTPVPCPCCVEGQRVGMFDNGKPGVCAGCSHLVSEHARINHPWDAMTGVTS